MISCQICPCNGSVVFVRHMKSFLLCIVVRHLLWYHHLICPENTKCRIKKLMASITDPAGASGTSGTEGWTGNATSKTMTSRPTCKTDGLSLGLHLKWWDRPITHKDTSLSLCFNSFHNLTLFLSPSQGRESESLLFSPEMCLCLVCSCCFIIWTVMLWLVSCQYFLVWMPCSFQQKLKGLLFFNRKKALSECRESRFMLK